MKQYFKQRKKKFQCCQKNRPFKGSLTSFDKLLDAAPVVDEVVAVQDGVAEQALVLKNVAGLEPDFAMRNSSSGQLEAEVGHLLLHYLAGLYSTSISVRKPYFFPRWPL
jgi:hypothetical protein